MTPQEFEYIRRAVTALESGEYSRMAEAKILQTVSEITARAADKIRGDLMIAVDTKLARNYQDLQNHKLVDILSQ